MKSCVITIIYISRDIFEIDIKFCAIFDTESTFNKMQNRYNKNSLITWHFLGGSLHIYEKIFQLQKMPVIKQLLLNKCICAQLHI